MYWARALSILAVLYASRAAAAQDRPPAFPSLSHQAEAARDAREFEKAIDLYKKALKVKPNWENGLWSLGSIEYDLDRYSDCAQAFRKLTELKPDQAPGWTMSGLCQYRLRNYLPALAGFAHVEQLAFNENAELARSARLHYSLLLTKTGSFEKAITVLTDLIRVDKKTPEIVRPLGLPVCDAPGCRQRFLNKTANWCTASATP